ncbi:hypothetical protein K1X84_13390 [bacterium]|nr:hypothetical protein [bacterium]
MHELTWYAILSLVIVTIAQHETAVVLWYTLLQQHFDHWSSAAVATFIVVSVIDLIWLYCLFFIFRNSFRGLAKIPWIHAVLERIKHRRWFIKIQPFFVKKEAPEEAAAVKTHDSRFKRLVKNSGHFGIFLCGALPGPGLKEIGIFMALTPKYRQTGFWLIFLAGLLKTVMTLLVYGGLHSAVNRMIEQWWM